MKFTKEEAVEKLTAALTNNGKKPLRMSARSLEGQTEDLMSLLDNDEMELDVFIEKVQPQMERFNANVGHDVSEAVKKALAGGGDPKPPTDPKPQEGDDVQKLMERIAALEKERADEKLKATADQKRRELKSQLKAKNVEDDWIDGILDLVSVDETSDVAEVTTSLVERYNKMMASRGGDPKRTPGPAAGSPAEPETFSDVVERMKVRQPE